MVDRISGARRSWNMSRIGSRDTAPEIVVRSILHRLGLRFRVNVRGIRGKPDIVLRRWQTVVFVHGCFWHRHPGCKFAYSPRSNEEFWNAKFYANTVRDQQVIADLKRVGWRVLVVWECETSDRQKLRRRLKQFFLPGSR